MIGVPNLKWARVPYLAPQIDGEPNISGISTVKMPAERCIFNNELKERSRAQRFIEPGGFGDCLCSSGQFAHLRTGVAGSASNSIIRWTYHLKLFVPQFTVARLVFYIAEYKISPHTQPSSKDNDMTNDEIQLYLTKFLKSKN